MSGAQEVYATIKRTSKYRYQQPTSTRVGGGGLPRTRDIPFCVTFGLIAVHGDYGVTGNANQYRPSDLNFYVRLDSGPSENWPHFVRL